MANGALDITARDPSAVPAQAPAPEQAPGASNLPEELVQNPVIQAVMAGSPAGVSGDIKSAQSSEFGQIIAKHSGALQEAGMRFYRSQDGKLGVMFNALKIPPEDIQAADQGGQLQQVAPPFESVEQALLSDPGSNPVLASDDPSGAAIQGPRAALPMPGRGQSGGATGRQLAGDRRRNLETGSPTSGPRPGAGRILNEILKPVI